MVADSGEQRKAKGTNLTQLVAALRKRQRTHSLGVLSPSAEQLLEERILEHVWYPHAPFVELLRVMYRDLLGSSEANALAVGISGGKIALQTWHTAYVMEGDPIGSVLAMRHSWRTYFNFGELKAEQDTPQSVTLTLTGYADVTAVHASMIAGWAVAAGQLGGSPAATGEIIDKPWIAGNKLRYRVTV